MLGPRWAPSNPLVSLFPRWVYPLMAGASGSGIAPIPRTARLTNLTAMGNSLLDFVMALVRDPQAAARYAADPAGALSGAGLPGVTVTDVQNLIPVVTDSLATATPSFGDAAASSAANVWTSGAAAAAFDAFHIPRPGPVVHEPLPRLDLGPIATPPADAAPYQPADGPLVDGLAPPAPAAAGPLDHPPLDPIAEDGASEAGWHQTHDLPPDHSPADHPGVDLF